MAYLVGVKGRGYCLIICWICVLYRDAPGGKGDGKLSRYVYASLQGYLAVQLLDAFSFFFH